MGYKLNKNLTLDRINVNGNYTPDNCRWATRKEQALNRRKTICLDNFTTSELVAELERRKVNERIS